MVQASGDATSSKDGKESKKTKETKEKSHKEKSKTFLNTKTCSSVIPLSLTSCYQLKTFLDW